MSKTDSTAMERRHQFQRAPSTISLICTSCRRRVTPCLVCAHLIRCCSCSPSPWIICGKCKVKNPLGDQLRRLLGLSPVSALPLSVVRRVLIAYIGRTACSMAAYINHQNLQKTQHGGTTDRQQSTPREFSSSVNYMNMPFLQCEGIVTTTDYQQIFGNRGHNSNHVPYRGENGANVNCNDCGNQCGAACLDDFTFNHNVTTIRHCEEQILALHCSEALSEDLNHTTYPICSDVRKSPLSIGQASKCHSKVGNTCLSRMSGTLNTSMLQLLNSAWISDFEVWLANKNFEGKDRFTFEEMLKSVDDFLLKRDGLLELQRSMLKAVAAQRQANADSKAFQQDQSQQSTVRLLEHFFVHKVEERKVKLKIDSEPFSNLLIQVNLFLQYMYSFTDEESRKENSTIPGQLFKKCNNVTNNRRVFEDIQMSVRLWLLLYHEVAHATGTI